ncbi:MAG: type II secretion system protein GspE [Actinobacteria bacterium]|nr:MAG: type II secretion system protein GspE [Actinomycetota bacterium]
MGKDNRLGQLLIKQKIIDEAGLQKALEEQEKTGKHLGRTLVEMGLIQEELLVAILASQAGIAYVDLSEGGVDRSAASLVTEETARKWVIIPIGFADNMLVVAMSNPSNFMAIDELRIKTGYKIKPVVATKTDIIDAINYQFSLGMSIQDESLDQEIDDVDIGQAYEDAPIVKLANLVVAKAVDQRASDIHIEPQEKDVRIRYRIDGVLHEVMKLPKNLQPAILSRFKIMSSMDIAENRKPQDGHMALTVAKRPIDFRVATLPTVHGERVVLRILEKSSVMLKLNDLGFSRNDLGKFRSVFLRPHGAILVTGPTGSGKSTTLYATLNILNTSAKNIVTIEDPVEYRLKGLNQIQVNPKAGLTFASGLRSILRGSPDIVMVGEIRDKETAQTAIEAALTGHLVLSTLHTNDAPGAISRLIEMGVEPFLVSSAISCVQAQRLARRLCKNCRQSYIPDVELLKSLGFPLTAEEQKNPPQLYRPVGCDKCNKTGYKGRIGLYEIMLVNEEIERLTVERTSAEEIKRAALKNHMTTLRQDGFEKVKNGMTSLEEILRVVV